MKATFRQSLSWSTQYDFLMVLPLQYPFWLKFWHVEGNVWVLLTRKGLNMKQWNGCVNWKGEKIQTNPHWFDFHGPPTHSQWSTLVSFSYKKTIKNKSKQPQLLRSRGSRDYFTPDEEEQREKKEKETGREKRGWTISLSGQLGPSCLTGFICAPLLGRSTTPWACWLSSTSRSQAPGRRSRSGPVRGKRDTVMLMKCTYDTFIKIGVQW